MKKIIIFGIYILLLTSIVIGADLIDKTYDKYILKDNIKECEGNFCYNSRAIIDFKEINGGFEFNGIKVTSTDASNIQLLIDKKTEVTSKVRFVPEITKSKSSTETEFVFNKQPDRYEEYLYFPNPQWFVDYVGADNLTDLSNFCKVNTGRCSHGTYKYYVFIWEEENIKLNTKKIDLNNGDIYNIERTDKGFKVTNLDGKTSISANDVINSGGEIWINGKESCKNLFNYIYYSAPECHYLNSSENLGNITSLNMKCEINLNGTLENCSEYSINFMLDELPDTLGSFLIHNNSRLNMSKGSMSWTSPNETFSQQTFGFKNAHTDVTNYSQYFKDFVFYSSYFGSFNQFNMTGDNVQLLQVGGSGGTVGEDSRLNGVGNGIYFYGDSLNFPMELEGTINGDFRDAVTAGVAFYIWQTNANISLTGGTYLLNDASNFFFGGALFTPDFFVNATFTDVNIVGGLDDLVTQFCATGDTYFYSTQEYNINASESDEGVVSNITVYTVDENENFENIVYNNISNKWNTPVLFFRETWAGCAGASVKTGEYTGRMVIKNSSYFPINSSLNIHKITIEGQKDMVKIPYQIVLNPDSEFSLNLG